MLGLFDLSPDAAEEIGTLLSPLSAGFGNMEDSYNSWPPALFTEKDVAAGQSIVEDHLNGVDGFRRLLHTDVVMER